MKRGEELKCGEELKKGEEWKRGEEWKSGEEFDGKSWIEKCWIEISNPRPEIKISLKLSMLQLCIELRPSRHFFRGFFSLLQNTGYFRPVFSCESWPGM